MPLQPARLTVVLASLLFGFSSCTKTGFFGGSDNNPHPEGGKDGKSGRSPTEIDTTCKGGTPGCISADQQATLRIKIVRLNSESWWKNCVNVGVFVDGLPTQQGFVPLGCNKDTPVGAEKALIGHKDKCNVLRIVQKTYQNVGNACNQNPNAPCNGPYSDVPTREKSTDRVEDRPFFEIFDARSLSLVFNVPSFATLVSPKDLALKDSVKGGEEINTWLRVFIEDQPRESLREWIDEKNYSDAHRKVLGIDYDDYIFDVQSRGGTKVAIDGENLYVDPKPASFLTPPGCL